MGVAIREMTLQDYDKVAALWNASEGIGLSEADSKENVSRYLARNPGLSLVACDGERLVVSRGFAREVGYPFQGVLENSSGWRGWGARKE